MRVLSVRGLTKVYSGRCVVSDVSFDLQPGTVTSFLGPNGAGKSTTLRMICGLSPPTSGEARIAGRKFREWASPCHVVGSLLDATATHPGRTGRGQLRLAAQLAGLPTRRVGEVLEMVGLQSHADRKIGTYSLGMRQRIALAHALLADPPLLLLDEPVNGLDPEGIRAIRILLRTHAERGGTVFLSSHLLSEVDQVADRVLVINGGRIVTDGPVSMLTKATACCLVHGNDNNLVVETLRWAGIAAAGRQDGYVVAQASQEEVARILFEANVEIIGLRQDERSLEEAFFDLTGGS